MDTCTWFGPSLIQFTFETYHREVEAMCRSSFLGHQKNLF